MQRSSPKFDADDRKVYTAWLGKTVAAYVALVLCFAAVVTVQAMMHTPNVSMLLADSVSQASP
jgi:hypothetical protein